MNDVRSPLPAKLLLALSLLALQLVGCTGMQPGYETPTVSVQSFRAVPSDAGTGLPSFEIGLHVTNPNLDPPPLGFLCVLLSCLKSAFQFLALIFLQVFIFS